MQETYIINFEVKLGNYALEAMGELCEMNDTSQSIPSHPTSPFYNLLFSNKDANDELIIQVRASRTRESNTIRISDAVSFEQTQQCLTHYFNILRSASRFYMHNCRLSSY